MPYAPTGAGFLGGTVDPLPISAAAQPPGLGYPAGFVGALSELRIWSVARTTAQIEQAMDAPLALDPTPPGLIGYYDFSQNSLANGVPGSPFGPATSDAEATGTSLSATYVVAGPSTIPADPFDGVQRLHGYRAFAPYLAIPFSNFAPKLDLASTATQVEYKVTLAVGDTVLVEVPGAPETRRRVTRSISSASPPTRPTGPTPCWSATRSSMPISRRSDDHRPRQQTAWPPPSSPPRRGPI